MGGYYNPYASGFSAAHMAAAAAAAAAQQSGQVRFALFYRPFGDNLSRILPAWLQTESHQCRLGWLLLFPTTKNKI